MKDCDAPIAAKGAAMRMAVELAPDPAKSEVANPPSRSDPATSRYQFPMDTNSGDRIAVPIRRRHGLDDRFKAAGEVRAPKFAREARTVLPGARREPFGR